MRVNNENLLIVDNVAQPDSLATSINLKPIWLGHIAQYAIQLVFSGTPTGNFKLQASCDPGAPNAQGEAQKYASVTNWTDIAGSAAAISAAGDVTWNAENVGYEWVRVVWTQTASTGTLTSARCKVKGV